MRVINVVHRVGGNLKESKAEARECLKAISKIRKIEEGDVSVQPSSSQQIMVVHNLEQTIKFGPQDFAKIQMPHENPLVVTVKILNCLVKRVLVDEGSSVELCSAYIQADRANR